MTGVQTCALPISPEVGDLVGLLLSDRAGYVTGAVLTADGGQSLGTQVYGPPVADAAAR